MKSERNAIIGVQHRRDQSPLLSIAESLFCSSYNTNGKGCRRTHISSVFATSSSFPLLQSCLAPFCIWPASSLPSECIVVSHWTFSRLSAICCLYEQKESQPRRENKTTQYCAQSLRFSVLDLFTWCCQLLKGRYA
jgi:hypothetical protein